MYVVVEAGCCAHCYVQLLCTLDYPVYDTGCSPLKGGIRRSRGGSAFPYMIPEKYEKLSRCHAYAKKKLAVKASFFSLLEENYRSLNFLLISPQEAVCTDAGFSILAAD